MKLEKCWQCLFDVMWQVLETKGNNDFQVRHKKSIRGGLGRPDTIPQALIDANELVCEKATADRNEIIADLRRQRNLADGMEQLGTQIYNKLAWYLRQDYDDDDFD